MDILEVFTLLTKIHFKLEEGLNAEFDEQEKTNPEFQFDTRITEARIELEELIDNLTDELSKQSKMK